MARKRIGELLVERGMLTPEQLEQGLAHQRATRQRLGLCLIQEGFLTEDQLANVLAEALELPRVELRAAPADWGAIHMLRARFCEQHDVFPVARGETEGKKHLIVAMADPLDAQAIQEIQFTTGLEVSPRLAPLSQVREAIQRCYHKASPPQRPAAVVKPPPPSPAPVAAVEEEEVIEGEVVEATPHDAAAEGKLDRLIRAHQERHRRKPDPAQSPLDALSEDLDYLLGADPDPVEQLERKFWVLVKILARKGLLTSDEFADALAEAEGE